MRAPTATISGGRWLVGSFEQTLPPIVPRLRTCTSAIVAQTSPRIGRAFASAEPISSEYVVIAPIVSVPSPASSIPRSSSSPFRSTSMSGDAARAFMTLISVCPPASARAPSFDASSSKASATDPGFAYSTSRSSIAAILRVDAGTRLPKQPAGTAGAHGQDLSEDRHGHLLRRRCAEVEAGRPRDAIQVLLWHAFLEEQPASPLLVPARAEPAEVERLGRERALHQREVELVVVRQYDDRGCGVGHDVRERLVGPENEELVGARHPLSCREPRTGVRH